MFEAPIHASASYLPRLHELHRRRASHDYDHHYHRYARHEATASAVVSHLSTCDHRREPKKNASRERMKTELHNLRVQASCLETELTYLQQLAQERMAVGSDMVLNDSEPIRNNREPSCGWKAMAERQRARRLRAEMQNRRLRATVEAQMDEWRSLQAQFSDKSKSLLDKIASVQGIPKYYACRVEGTAASPSGR